MGVLRRDALLTPLRLGGPGAADNSFNHEASSSSDGGSLLNAQRLSLETPPAPVPVAALSNEATALANEYRGASNLLGTIRFLFVSVAALRVQASIVPPIPTMQAPQFLAAPPVAESERPLNVLCLDGGGVKGRNLMVMIAEIEEACGRPVSEMFDLIAGTSIGGCGALFLSKFKDDATSKAQHAFASLQSTCMQQQSMLRLVSQGHLCLDSRPRFLRDLVGTQTLSSDGPRAFAVASREGKHGLEPYLFRTYECDALAEGGSANDGASGGSSGDEGAEGAGLGTSVEAGSSGGKPAGALPGTSAAQLWEAVVATSAAPLFFPRAHFGDERFADGGLVANDPTLIAVREAATLWPKRALGLVVSLGTGAQADGYADGYADEEGQPRRLGAPAHFPTVDMHIGRSEFVIICGAVGAGEIASDPF